MIHNIDVHRHCTLLVRELQGVGKEVQKDLQESPLVSMDLLDQVQVLLHVNLGPELHTTLTRAEPKDLEGFVNSFWQAEVLIVELERVAF